MQLRPYQHDLHNDILAEWAAGRKFVLAVLPTGGGKTVTFSHVVKELRVPAILLAHRAEIVSQMSLALAREGVRHRIIGPKSLIKLCIRTHNKHLRYSMYDANSPVAVASVQSVTKPQEWYAQVRLWVQDEAHHVLRNNQFGKALQLFPNAKGLGVTATPGRADGRGLGAHADGVFESMVEGPDSAWLMANGFLSKYKIYAPPSTLKREELRVSDGGDFNKEDLKKATRKSTVMGDVISHYLTHALGKLGLTFADSIENAVEIAQKFRDSGVPAEVLTGKTDGDLRSAILAKFENREIWQIVSVALIDEGFDCPGVEVVSDAAATESLARYLQRFGRGWRTKEGKDHMIYFDHVGNVMRHGLPDAFCQWSLDRREKRAKKKDDAIPIKVCVNCFQPYERVHRICPYCEHYMPPAARSGPEYVDGDLTELDGAVLAAMRGEIARIDGDFYAPQSLGPAAAGAARRNHMERQDHQRSLRNAISWWSGLERKAGHDDSESYRRFYFRFGVDVNSAQVLGARDADELAGRVLAELQSQGIDGTVNISE